MHTHKIHNDIKHDIHNNDNIAQKINNNNYNNNIKNEPQNNIIHKTHENNNNITQETYICITHNIQ